MATNGLMTKTRRRRWIQTGSSSPGCQRSLALDQPHAQEAAPAHFRSINQVDQSFACAPVELIVDLHIGSSQRVVALESIFRPSAGCLVHNHDAADQDDDRPLEGATRPLDRLMGRTSG